MPGDLHDPYEDPPLYGRALALVVRDGGEEVPVAFDLDPRYERGLPAVLAAIHQDTPGRIAARRIRWRTD